MKYRKKPVVIEAVQIPCSAMPEWLSDAMREGIVWIAGGASVRIKTLEGVMTASHGDWIIRGIKGELYPCKPDIFETTYEVVT